MKKLLLSCILFCTGVAAFAQVSGVVHKDYNASGERDNSATLVEPFALGVTVKAYNASGLLIGTKTTSITGTYSFSAAEIPAGTPVRIEFTGYPASYYSGCATGTLTPSIIGSSVQFVTAPNATADFRINNPDNYSQANPMVIRGQNYTGPHTNNAGDGAFNGSYYNTGQILDPVANGGTIKEFSDNPAVGATYGLAYSRKSKRLYAAAVIRNYFGTKIDAANGDGGFDDIHTFTFSDPTPATPSTATLSQGASIDLSVLGVNMGTDPRPTAITGTTQYTDNATLYQKVGKIGIGDIDISSDGDTLFVVNMNEAAPSLAIINVTNPATPVLISNVALAMTPCTNGVFRPWGVKYFEGKVYIGGVCDASTGTASNLAAYVYRYDGGTTFTQVATTPLSYARSKTTFRVGGTYQHANWLPWTNVWAPEVLALGPDLVSQPQPMLTDIEFTEDGSMVLGFADRFSYQTAYNQRRYDVTTGSTFFSTVAAGDVLKLCNVSGSFELEGGAGCTRTNTDNGSVSPSNPASSPRNISEFFDDDYYNTGSSSTGDAGHSETALGALAVLAGRNQLLATSFDPISTIQPGGTSGEVNTSGVRFYNSDNGNQVQITTATASHKGWIDFDQTFVGTNRKGGNMGDIEILADAAPIEIGNRLWNDANANGIQDAGEAVFVNVTVELYLDANNDCVPDGAALATVTTDANGQYIFSNQVTAEYVSGNPGFGHAKFNISQLVSKQHYILRIGAADWNSATGQGAGVLAGYRLTTANVSGSGMPDWSDNDALITTITGSQFAQICLTTGILGENNHTYDFGFRQIASIGDKVWRDDDKDGIQDAGEPGVAGITVTLYQNGADGAPGTADDVVMGTTVTDAYGIYLFDNLVPSTTTATSYNVGFTLPANYQFTTQTNTQVTGTDNATNTTVATGGSTAANGSDANTATGRTGSFWLAPNEAERGADAGIIFSTPTTLNSIGDKVWFDLNSNGTQDGTEQGIAGVTVTLYNNAGNVLATTITDANGNYMFTNLPDGNYRVGVSRPAGLNFTATGVDNVSGGPGDSNTDSDIITFGANAGTTNLIDLDAASASAAGVNYTNVDAGFVLQLAGTASLGDKVWNDINNNGTQDAGEPGIAGVTVNLYEDVDGDGVLSGGELTPLRTTVTDAFGYYIFNTLTVTATNKWLVEFVQPSGYSNTAVANNNSGNDATDSDIIDNATDRTGFIRLKADERNLNIDAGFIQTTPAGTLKLGDKVWRDNDADGQQDGNEPGVAGITAKLYQNGPDGLPGTSDDVLIGTTYTDINGNYQFVNLAATTNAQTNYNVQFSNIPGGYSFTTQDAGADVTDSDVNGFGKTGSVNLTADNMTIDAGIVQGTPSGLGSLGDRVWYDLDNNGVQDAGELGVAGVTVALYLDANNDGLISGAELTPVQTTATNALGEYMFGGLNAGNFQVGFTLPAALSTYALSPKDAAAATDATDSDGNPKNTSIAGNTAGLQTSYTDLVSLAQGEDKLIVDLGIVPPSNTNTLGGTAWYDVNSDGLQGDPGRIPGVMVTLYNSSGNPIATTTTDDNGDYLFVGLPDGDYSVGFSNYPAGYSLTVKETTNTPGTGSDADVTNNRTATVTLGAGNRNDRSLDVGVVSSRAALGNRVWEDLNGDGIQDAGEPGVGGVTVTLWDDFTNQRATTVTDANGYYFFPNVIPGLYQVGFSTIPNGMEFTTKDVTSGPDGDGSNTWTGGGDSDVNPTGTANFINRTDVINFAGGLNLTIDAGLRRTPTATVGNRVWDDLDADGLQEAGEPGIPGVIATLYNSSNQPIGSAVTGANGEWLITNVPVGTDYYVIFTNKPVGNWTVQDNGGAGTGGGTDTDTDSDVNPSGQTGTFNVVAGDYNIVIDAGITMTFTILPVRLEFTAVKSGSSAILSWVVSGERDVRTYILERSSNNQQYSEVARFTADGRTSYNTADAQPFKGINYYRVRIENADGSISYSEVRIVRFEGSGVITVFPNPVKDRLNIQLPDSWQGKQVTIDVVSMSGQVVQRETTTNAGQTESLPVANLPVGVYQIRISNATGEIETRKVIKN